MTGMLLKKRISVLFFLLLIFAGLLAQTSRFEKTFRKSDGTLLTGATIYIVNQATSDSLLLTEHPTRTGTYYRDNVPYGHYKVYVNGALITKDYYFAAIRERDFIEAVDPDANNQIDTQGIEDGAVTTAKVQDSTLLKRDLSQTLIDYINASGGGTITNYPDGVTIKQNVGNELYADTTLLAKKSDIDKMMAADTTALKNIIANDGDFVYLKQLSPTNPNGGGWFVLVDSTYPEGVIAFDAPTAGKQWVRSEVIKNKYYRYGSWGNLISLYESLPDSGGIIFLPPGRYDVLDGLNFKKKIPVSIIGDDRWRKYISVNDVSNNEYPKSLAPVIYSSKGAKYLFDFNDGVYKNGYGFVFKNLAFEVASAKTENVINIRSVTMGEIKGNIFWGADSVDTDSTYAIRLYADTTVGGDASWWRIKENIVVNMNFIKIGRDDKKYGHNQNIIADNICFNSTRDSVNSAPAIWILGGNRNVIENNNIEGYNKGIYLDNTSQSWITGNAGENTRKFIIMVSGVGNYINNFGISSPTAASGDTLLIIKGSPISNFIILPSVSSNSPKVYSMDDFIKIADQSAFTRGNNILQASGIVQPTRSYMPFLLSMEPFYGYANHSSIEYKDVLEGKLPDSLEYYNGSAWIDWSSSEDFREVTLNTSDYVTIDSTHKKIRVWYSVDGLPYIFVLMYGGSSMSKDVGVTLEFLDNSNSLIKSFSDSSVVQYSDGGFMMQAGEYNSNIKKVRITLNFEFTDNVSYLRIVRIKLLTWNYLNSQYKPKIISGDSIPQSYATGNYGTIYIDRTLKSGFPVWISKLDNSKNGWIPLQIIDSGNTLPTPSSNIAGKQFLKLGGSGVADSLFICKKNAAGTYNWEFIK